MDIRGVLHRTDRPAILYGATYGMHTPATCACPDGEKKTKAAVVVRSYDHTDHHRRSHHLGVKDVRAVSERDHVQTAMCTHAQCLPSVRVRNNKTD